jgi:DNA-binding NarL/FixJ family response regulator
MPILNGMEVINRVHKTNPHIEIVILSMYTDESLVIKAFRSGARGYLIKNSLTEELITGLRAASQGVQFISKLLPNLNYFTSTYRELPATDQFDRLTDRERQVCKLVAEGYTNQAIAHQLGLSIKTVEKHRSNMMQKLGVQDVASLIREAIRHSIIFLEG